MKIKSSLRRTNSRRVKTAIDTAVPELVERETRRLTDNQVQIEEMESLQMHIIAKQSDSKLRDGIPRVVLHDIYAHLKSKEQSEVEEKGGFAGKVSRGGNNRIQITGLDLEGKEGVATLRKSRRKKVLMEVLDQKTEAGRNSATTSPFKKSKSETVTFEPEIIVLDEFCKTTSSQPKDSGHTSLGSEMPSVRPSAVLDSSSATEIMPLDNLKERKVEAESGQDPLSSVRQLFFEEELEEPTEEDDDEFMDRVMRLPGSKASESQNSPEEMSLWSYAMALKGFLGEDATSSSSDEDHASDSDNDELQDEEGESSGKQDLEGTEIEAEGDSMETSIVKEVESDQTENFSPISSVNPPGPLSSFQFSELNKNEVNPTSPEITLEPSLENSEETMSPPPHLDPILIEAVHSSPAYSTDHEIESESEESSPPILTPESEMDSQLEKSDEPRSSSSSKFGAVPVEVVDAAIYKPIKLSVIKVDSEFPTPVSTPELETKDPMSSTKIGGLPRPTRLIMYSVSSLDFQQPATPVSTPESETTENEISMQWMEASSEKDKDVQIQEGKDITVSSLLQDDDHDHEDTEKDANQISKDAIDGPSNDVLEPESAYHDEVVVEMESGTHENTSASKTNQPREDSESDLETSLVIDEDAVTTATSISEPVSMEGQAVQEVEIYTSENVEADAVTGVPEAIPVELFESGSKSTVNTNELISSLDNKTHAKSETESSSYSSTSTSDMSFGDEHGHKIESKVENGLRSDPSSIVSPDTDSTDYTLSIVPVAGSSSKRKKSKARSSSSSPQQSEGLLHIRNSSCPQCRKGYTSQAQKDEHIIGCHCDTLFAKSRHPSLTESQFKLALERFFNHYVSKGYCPPCQFYVPSAEKFILRKHFVNDHFDEVQENLVTFQEEWLPHLKVDEDPEEYVERSFELIKEGSHASFVCNICGKCIRRNSRLDHLRTHGFDMLKCRFCNDLFGRASAKTRHELREHNELLFKKENIHNLPKDKWNDVVYSCLDSILDMESEKPNRCPLCPGFKLSEKQQKVLKWREHMIFRHFDYVAEKILESQKKEGAINPSRKRRSIDDILTEDTNTSSWSALSSGTEPETSPLPLQLSTPIATATTRTSDEIAAAMALASFFGNVSMEPKPSPSPPSGVTSESSITQPHLPQRTTPSSNNSATVNFNFPATIISMTSSGEACPRPPLGVASGSSTARRSSSILSSSSTGNISATSQIFPVTISSTCWEACPSSGVVTLAGSCTPVILEGLSSSSNASSSPENNSVSPLPVASSSSSTNKSTEVVITSISCKFCRQTFADFGLMDDHIIGSHCDILFSSSQHPSLNQFQFGLALDLFFSRYLNMNKSTCQFCNMRIFKTEKFKLRKHLIKEHFEELRASLVEFQRECYHQLRKIHSPEDTVKESFTSDSKDSQNSTCNICGKQIANKNGCRVNHLRSMHGYEMLKCNFCEETFGMSDSRRRHELRVHCDLLFQSQNKRNLPNDEFIEIVFDTLDELLGFNGDTPKKNRCPLCPSYTLTKRFETSKSKWRVHMVAMHFAYVCEKIEAFQSTRKNGIREKEKAIDFSRKEVKSQPKQDQKSPSTSSHSASKQKVQPPVEALLPNSSYKPKRKFYYLDESSSPEIPEQKRIKLDVDVAATGNNSAAAEVGETRHVPPPTTSKSTNRGHQSPSGVVVIDLEDGDDLTTKNSGSERSVLSNGVQKSGEVQVRRKCEEMGPKILSSYSIAS